MAQVWDNILKRLFKSNPQYLISLLLPGAEYISEQPGAEGLDIGLEEGREQGREEGNQRMRNVTISFIEDHFPSLLASTKEIVQAIKDPDKLQRLLMDVVSARTLEEAEQIIHTTQNDRMK